MNEAMENLFLTAESLSANAKVNDMPNGEEVIATMAGDVRRVVDRYEADPSSFVAGVIWGLNQINRQIDVGVGASASIYSILFGFGFVAKELRLVGVLPPPADPARRAHLLDQVQADIIRIRQERGQ